METMEYNSSTQLNLLDRLVPFLASYLLNTMRANNIAIYLDKLKNFVSQMAFAFFCFLIFSVKSETGNCVTGSRPKREAVPRPASTLVMLVKEGALYQLELILRFADMLLSTFCFAEKMS